MKPDHTTCLPAPSGQHRRNARPGFTLVELMVSILIVAVLVTLAFVFTRRATLAANKTADLSNVRQLANMSFAMATDGNGNLPQLHLRNHIYPYWFTMDSRRQMEENGLSREKAYANTNNLTGGKPSYKWWDYSASATVFHYVYFADDSSPGGTPWWTDSQKVRKPSSDEFHGDRAVLDTNRVFARNLGDQVWYPIVWGSLCREYAGDLLCATMDGGKPLGINAVYLDGSASWIPREQLAKRLTINQFTLWW